jgi:hypothetical protein
MKSSLRAARSLMVREPFLEIGPGISDTSQQRCLESWINRRLGARNVLDCTNYFCCRAILIASQKTATFDTKANPVWFPDGS